ncbi:hypothetical protein Pint_24686 [Pistacia integerrima]|uniref:Uncharacterized protein n=1 Tax=Pistacia integerrima TaxID=434235 RepID=A0ACC0YHU4_9ROSI|nr:hypothetical protein Pint_24686 [Pistacia integerrima]
MSNSLPFELLLQLYRGNDLPCVKFGSFLLPLLSFTSYQIEVQKELQDAMQQLEAIRYEIRSVSLINPGPLTRKLMDSPPEPASNHDDNASSQKCEGDYPSTGTVLKDHRFKPYGSLDLHSQATAFARLAESEAVKSGSLKSIVEKENSEDEAGLFTVLPVSAESTGMLPNHKESAKGSDILLEAVLESEVAHNAKDFFSQPENQMP